LAKESQIKLPPAIFTLNICMENAQLTLTDIISVKHLIDAACTRGAFKAHEMQSVGELYNKISRFVDETQAQIQAQQPAESTPTPEGE
jgi:hypothetical protein